MTQAVTMLGKQAVLEGLAAHPAVQAVVTWNVDALTDAKFDRDELTLTVTPETVSEACQALRAAGYNFFEDVTAVDWHPATPRFQLSYHLLSHSLKERIRLCTRVEDSDPSVPTITTIWAGQITSSARSSIFLASVLKDTPTCAAS